MGSIGGLALSSVVIAASLYRSFESFQANERFKQAIDNLRAGRAFAQGIPVPNAPQKSGRANVEGESTPWAQSSGDGSEFTTATYISDSVRSIACIGTYDAPSEGQPVTASASRWADIRAANNSAKTSTWDRIREQRAKADNPSSASPSSVTPSAPANPFFSGIPVPSTPISRKQPAAFPPNKKPGTGIEGELESSGEVLDKKSFETLLEAERSFGVDQDKKPSRWS